MSDVPFVEEDTSIYLAGLPDLVPPANRRLIPRSTSVLLALLLASGTFVGGVALQKHRTPAASTPAAALAAFASGRGANAGGAGRGFGGAAASSGAAAAAVGEVKLVDGTNVYVTTAAGEVVKVATSTSSSISKSAAAGLSDIDVGDTVTVQGRPDIHGTVQATRIDDSGVARTPSNASSLTGRSTSPAE
jgi:hypothetical protein